MSDNVIRGTLQAAYRTSSISLSVDNSPVSVGVDSSGNLLETLNTAILKTIDSITSRPEGTVPVNLTASGVVSAVPCLLTGAFVNSFSSGTTKLYDNASAASGTVLNNTITWPAVGYYPLGVPLTANGVYATIGGTLDITFYIIPV